MNHAQNCNRGKTQNGFSLLEVSIVLIIMGLLLSSVLKPFGAQLIERQRKETTSRMLEIREAIVGFAAANHRLPCPTTLASGPDGDCTKAHGFVPATLLGVDGSRDIDGLLVDSWGAPILYSVSVSDADGDGSADFTAAQGMQEVGMQSLLPDFEICDSASACVHMRANRVPVVLVSTGVRKNSQSTDEIENTDGDSRFVSKDLDQVGTDQFDDIVVWVSVNVLYTQLIQARVLP